MIRISESAERKVKSGAEADNPRVSGKSCSEPRISQSEKYDNDAKASSEIQCEFGLPSGNRHFSPYGKVVGSVENSHWWGDARFRKVQTAHARPSVRALEATLEPWGVVQLAVKQAMQSVSVYLHYLQIYAFNLWNAFQRYSTLWTAKNLQSYNPRRFFSDSNVREIWSQQSSRCTAQVLWKWCTGSCRGPMLH